VLVKLEVTAKRNVPDALVVDLLPAGLELENQNLANSSASLQENGERCRTCLTRCSRRIFSTWSSRRSLRRRGGYQ
jgi:predicted glycosyltransferase